MHTSLPNYKYAPVRAEACSEREARRAGANVCGLSGQQLEEIRWA